MPSYVIHSEDEIRRIRIAAEATARVRDELAKRACPGMSTLELDRIAAALITQENGRSAFLGYCGFPGNICISLNEEVVHGIGSADRIMTENDIVSIDIGVEIDGAIGDTALTFALRPDPSPAVEMLLKTTNDALMAGIEQAVCGNYLNDICSAIEKVANSQKLGVVRDFVGHGVGTKLHEPPEVPNFRMASKGPKLQKGMVLAIEPMFNLGTAKVSVDKFNHWTVRSLDKSLSAHFEHTILITDNKPEILTWPKTM
jgi:methionyl aminopeptidase